MVTAAAVKTYARAIGFDLVGITTADALHPHEEHLRKWIAAGMHGEMEYMERLAPTAAVPTQLVPGARSIVVVGLSYRWDRGDAETDAAVGAAISTALQSLDQPPMARNAGASSPNS